MSEVRTIGLDLAKSVFQVHGADERGAVVFRKRLRRGQVLKFFRGLPRCLVAMEACGSSHFWAREIGRLGHEVRMIPPAYVKPFVKRQKNDMADAEAICEAACAFRSIRPVIPITSGHPLAAMRPEDWLSVLGAFVTCSEFGFPHALAVEFDAIGVVDEAILGKVNKVQYQRLLAKTAHAFVSAKIGPDAFEPCLTDIILNRSDDVGRYVGDIPGVHGFAENPESTFQISMGSLINGPAEGYIAVYLQLYPSIRSPEHVIIVGKPKVDLNLRYPDA